MPGTNTSQERMLIAAVQLFARSGYSGTTTRDVSRLAKVSESNIFRYFPTKRELFLGSIEFELQKLSISAETLIKVVNARNSRVALRSLLEVIIQTVAKQPELVRLLHFSVLDFGPDVELMLRQYLHPIIEALAKYLQKCSQDHGLPDIDPVFTILSFIATVVLMQQFLPVFYSSPPPYETVQSAAAAYADIWCRAFSTPPTPEALKV